MIAPTHAIDVRTSVLGAQGRLVVCCEIEHFIPSGLSVPNLFARLRPQVVVAIKDAAARAPLIDAAPRAPSVHMDVGSPDPSITLWVHSPATALADLEACFHSLEGIVTRFAVAEMAAEGGVA